ncbi:MAG: alpha/beta hydrolase [Planctomycetota bacterium]
MPKEKSTTVRALPFSLRATRFALTNAARVAPAPAARAASWMFCRPARYRLPEAERDLLKVADPFDVRLGRQRLRAWRWGGGERVVLLVHGWSGRGAQLGGLVQPLLDRGFTVVAFDGPGHGASTGTSSSLVEMADACFAVTRTLRRAPHGIVGHSMGAAAAAIATAEGLDAERAVWISPPASLAYFIDEYAAFLGFRAPARDSIVRTMESTFRVAMDDLDVERIEVTGGERMLVLHDLNDREVPAEHGRRVARAFGASFEATSGLGHRRILRDRAVASRVAQWIGGHLDEDTSSPNGFEVASAPATTDAITRDPGSRKWTESL